MVDERHGVQRVADLAERGTVEQHVVGDRARLVDESRQARLELLHVARIRNRGGRSQTQERSAGHLTERVGQRVAPAGDVEQVATGHDAEAGRELGLAQIEIDR